MRARHESVGSSSYDPGIALAAGEAGWTHRLEETRASRHLPRCIACGFRLLACACIHQSLGCAKRLRIQRRAPPVRRLPSPQTDIPAPRWFSRAFAGKARSDIARRILDRTVACLLQTRRHPKVIRRLQIGLQAGGRGLCKTIGLGRALLCGECWGFLPLSDRLTSQWGSRGWSPPGALRSSACLATVQQQRAAATAATGDEAGDRN